MIEEVSTKTVVAGAKIDEVINSIKREAEIKVEIASQKLIDIEDGIIEKAEEEVIKDIEKPTTPFMKAWGKLKESIDKNDWVEVAKNVFVLMGANVFPEDVKVYAGTVQIGPAGVGLASKLFAGKLTPKGFIEFFKMQSKDALQPLGLMLMIKFF